MSWPFRMELGVTCASCPFQIEGTVDGRKLYYRERHNRWRLELDGLMVAGGEDEDQDDLGVALGRIGEVLRIQQYEAERRSMLAERLGD